MSAEPAIVGGAAASDLLAAGLLGAHVRGLRKARGLTLVQLATATELSHPFLSQLERGLAQPSLGSLRRIAVALGTSPLELIAAAEAPTADVPATEVHRGAGGDLEADFAVGSGRLLAHPVRPFHPMVYAADNTAPGDYFAHAEDEFSYVLDGRVCLDLDGEVTELGVGDSSYYAGGVAHRTWSADGAPFRLLIVKQRPPHSAATD
ncbi:MULTISPECIES: XRE family transcriptional regulator [Microbacterium]|uniref:XRE family transcriptional regulator n=2 Tax=Microbacteriaceae TaxID=85023 RepID=UPI000B0A912E|nr:MULTISPECIES: XRE family transcriptional regulator [unclassified Microbacterium]MCK9919592.1 helix-turn-helix domain-containing protein [Microbacteriaceae bacterium K1510]